MKRFVRVRTKNFTADPLKGAIPTNHRAVVRLGSLTPTGKIFPNKRDIIEINTVEAIENSRNKLRMKDCFRTLKVPQSEWWASIDGLAHRSKEEAFPLVVKRVFGFKGKGMELINTPEELDAWMKQHPKWSSEGWYFEKFYNYAREYRLHVAKDRGIFMSWRKLRKEEAKERWFFNSTNCNWIGVDHELFDKPKCWKAMEEAAINAALSTGLDIGAVDIRVQSNEQKDPKFIVCEINSAPALGDLGIEKYKEIINELINKRK